MVVGQFITAAVAARYVPGGHHIHDPLVGVRVRVGVGDGVRVGVRIGVEVGLMVRVRVGVRVGLRFRWAALCCFVVHHVNADDD